jgi:hypothetical protein
MSHGPGIVSLLAAVALAGCAGGDIGVRAGDASTNHGNPPPGTSYSTAAVRAEVSPGAYLGMVFFGSVIMGLQDDSLRRRYGNFSRRPPELDGGRAIAERDCSLPLGPMVENLRCK